MFKRIKSDRTTEFARPALLEGNRSGDMPVPLGKWIWPASAIALALTTAWSATRIEAQVDAAAPEILSSAGIDPQKLSIDTDYRTVNVTGELPANTSNDDIELILAGYTEQSGVRIRDATALARLPVVVKNTPAQPPKPMVNPAPEDVRVSAVVNDDKITLTGMVPAQSDLELLSDAARVSFDPQNISNNLTVTNKPPISNNQEYHLNNLATVIASLSDDILDAHIDLDNHLITGSITAASTNATNRIVPFLPATLISVITDQEPTVDALLLQTASPELKTESPSLSPTVDEQVNLLQLKLDQLAAEIEAGVVFTSGSATLQPAAKSVLDEIVTALYIYPDTTLQIDGHTDSLSSAAYNLLLSHQRAQAVAHYLESSGIEKNRLIAAGFGETMPVADNINEAGRAKNRRVEFNAVR